MANQARLFKLLLALVIALAAAGIVGIDDPELEQQTYCNNVRDGVWPDYHGTYKAECGGKEPPKFDANLTK